MTVRLTTVSIGIAAAFLISLLQSCSSRGAVLLHNATGGGIEVHVFDYHYKVADGKSEEVRVDPVFAKHTFSIRTRNGLLCYVMPKVDPAWIKPGFFRSKAYGVIDRVGQIFLFPPASDEDHFFKEAAPSQPEGFPITGNACPESGHRSEL